MKFIVQYITQFICIHCDWGGGQKKILRGFAAQNFLELHISKGYDFL